MRAVPRFFWLLAVVWLPAAGDVDRQSSKPPFEESAIRRVFEDYYAAYEARNVDRTVKFWHTQSIDYPAVQKRLAAFFPLQQYTFSNLSVTRIQRGVDEVTARVAVDVVVTTGGPSSRPERQRWIRSVILREEEGVWHIYRESDPIEALVRRLRRASSQDERMAMVAEDPELITPDLAREIEREVMVMGLRPEQALDWYRMMEHVARQAKSVEFAGAALLGRARVCEALKETSVARDLYARAIAEFEAAGLPERVGDAEATVATSYLKRLDYANARAHFEKAVSAFERGADRAALSSVLHSLGTTDFFEGEWDQALTHYRRSLGIQQDLAVGEGTGGSSIRRRGVAAAYQAVGMVNQERGDFEAAADAYAESLRRFRELNEAAGVIAVTVDLARLSRRQGNPDAALRRYLESLDVASRVDSAYRDLPRIAGITREIADLLTLERRYAGALDYYQRSLETSAQDGYQQGTGAALAGIGAVHYLQGRHDAALGFYSKSLAVREALGDQSAIAWTLLNIGLVQSAAGKHSDALDSYARSLGIARTLKNLTWEAILLTLTARSQLGQQTSDAALESARQAQTLATEIDDPDVLERAHLIASAVHRQKGRLDEAAREIESAIQALERRRSDRTFGQRDEFFGDDEGPWTAKAQLAFERGRIPEAFAAAEHLKVQRLRDAIGTEMCRGLTPEERGEERRLAHAVVSVGRQLWRQRRQPNADKARTAGLEDELLQLTSQRSAYDAVVSAKHPDLAVLRARVEPISLDAVRQLIPDARTVILEFLVTEEETYLFLFAKDGSSTTTIEQPAAAITRLATRFRELLMEPDSKPDETARELYDLLIRPVASRLEGRQRLVVVPDAALWGLPFQALKAATGRFLIQDVSVEYASSLTALAALERLDAPQAAAGASGRYNLVAFGSPDAASGTAQLILAGVVDVGTARSVEANREATAIAALFPKGSRAFVGRDATREAALNARARFVHFATMGRVSDTSPMRSQLFFAPGSSKENILGTLDVADFADWDPRAEVVVLSRLDDPVTTTGEGSTALSWALFATGARSVVLSNWSVNAPAGSPASVGLFSRLQPTAPGTAGRRTAAALREALLSLQQAAPYRHPHYWANLNVFAR